MENIVYLSVLILLAVGWACTYLYMLMKLNEVYEVDEVYEEEYTLYTDTEERSIFVSSIEYDEVYGNYHIKYCYTSDDEFVRLPKYEALALVMALNCYRDIEEEIFKLKKL